MSALKEKVALITGASCGIGIGVAEKFASQGCALALSGRNIAALEVVKKKCLALGLKDNDVLLVPGDLTVDSNIVDVVNKTTAHFGKLDILVNSAGILTFGSIETQTTSDYDRCMNINLRSVVLITQQAVPHLIKTKGNVVVISGTTGIRGNPRLLAISMAKAALNSFTQVTALDLAPKGVRVNSVNPGIVKTELHLRGGMPKEEYDTYLERGAAITHPLGRICTVEDVANAVIFLASAQASFVTGINMPIDGGRVLTFPK